MSDGNKKLEIELWLAKQISFENWDGFYYFWKLRIEWWELMIQMTLTYQKCVIIKIKRTRAYTIKKKKKKKYTHTHTSQTKSPDPSPKTHIKTQITQILL